VSIEAHGVEISQTVLKNIWQKHFSDKAFPNVKAALLLEKEFVRVAEEMRKTGRFIDTSPEEHGRMVRPDEGTALALRVPLETGKAYYIMLNHEYFHEWERWLTHELRHIYNDL